MEFIGFGLHSTPDLVNLFRRPISRKPEGIYMAQIDALV